MKALIQHLFFLAGIGQITLATCSLIIPKLLNWKTELAKVQPLIKQLFWTYAAYILVINFSFGLVSVFATDELTGGSHLATLLTGFITTYWVSRVLIQFFHFDRAGFPTGTWYKIGEIALVSLFITLCAVYGTACYLNYTHH